MYQQPFASTEASESSARCDGHDSLGHPRCLKHERTHRPGAFLMNAVAQCGAVDPGASTWYSPPSLDAAEGVTEALFLCRLSGGHAEIFGALIPASTPGGSAHSSWRNLESSSGRSSVACVRRIRRASVSAGSVSHRQACSALSSCLTLVNFQVFRSGPID